jgi:alkaline phosphatase D
VAKLTSVSRRGFLLGSLAAGALTACSGGEARRGAATSTTASASTLPVPAFDGPPFGLGVASGDPLPDRVILWTRLVPDVAAGGGAPDVDVPVRWEVADDADFGRTVASGTVVASPAWGHSVHVDADGLEPDSTYWYRFEVGGHQSLVGRTRTAPAVDSSPARLHLAVASCQAWHPGYYTAHRHLAEEDLDVVLWAGDYIYELNGGPGIRPHQLTKPVDLTGFRRRYAMYKSDTDLQAAHAAHPWLVTWDDHEVEDNYAGMIPARSNAPDEEAFVAHQEAFPALRAAAYQAWYEHQPVRLDPPEGSRFPIHRRFTWGDLADLWLLDTRQHRTDQPEGPAALARPFGGGPQGPEAFDPEATMLGADQRDWLIEGLLGSAATWKAIATPSVMAEIDRGPEVEGGRFSTDGWDGYVAERNLVLGTASEAGVDNLISVTGDIHTACVADLKADFQDPASPVVAAELVSPSISSLELISPEMVAGARANDHVHLYDIDRRGYLRCQVTDEGWRADFWLVATTQEPESAIETASSWMVEPDQPGARPA